MIKLTKLDGKEFVLNCDLIESIEANPDTVLTLRTEKKIIVKEPLNEVLNRIVSYKQTVYSTPYFQRGGRTYVNSDESDIFANDKDLKRMKNRDITYLDEYEDDTEYYEDED